MPDASPQKPRAIPPALRAVRAAAADEMRGPGSFREQPSDMRFHRKLPKIPAVCKISAIFAAKTSAMTLLPLAYLPSVALGPRRRPRRTLREALRAQPRPHPRARRPDGPHRAGGSCRPAAPADALRAPRLLETLAAPALGRAGRLLQGIALLRALRPRARTLLPPRGGLRTPRRLRPRAARTPLRAPRHAPAAHERHLRGRKARRPRVPETTRTRRSSPSPTCRSSPTGRPSRPISRSSISCSPKDRLPFRT